MYLLSVLLSFLLSFLLSSFWIVNSFVVTPQHALRKAVWSSSSVVKSSSQNTEDAAGDLTSTLARLDQQWKIQQSTQRTSRWTKLVLTDGDGDDFQVKEESPNDVSSASSLIPGGDYVYLLEPPYNSMPSCMIVFTGGAGLGTYPQIAYNELLLRISNRLNAAVITAPYQVGLDHFAIAKQTGEKARKALIHCQEKRMYPESLPTYSLSHSLGAKLSTIYMAATDYEYDGVGFISFNNFGFGDTIGMAKEFADTIRSNSFAGRSAGAANPFDAYTKGISNDVLDTIFGFAEQAVSMIGIDFTPKPADMERLIQMKYSPERQQKTRLFSFDNDRLENTQQFVNACDVSSSGTGVQISGLQGTHLTPVYFKLGWDQIPSDNLPPEAREMAKEAMGGFQSASFGNEDELNALVDEVCDWLMGKQPSRKPAWIRERPRLAGSSSNNDD